MLPGGMKLPNLPDRIVFPPGQGSFGTICRQPRNLMRNDCMESSVLARQIRTTSQEFSADVRLCLTVTSLYTVVGLGLIVAFM
jgi:hypothetical protein